MELFHHPGKNKLRRLRPDLKHTMTFTHLPRKLAFSCDFERPWGAKSGRFKALAL